MQLANLDYIIIILFLIITLVIGIYASRQAGKSTKDYFLSGNNMPWWMLGISMVATTFSADTPNLVTDIVRENGVAGNWAWWAFLLTGMLTVFIYSRLWRRAGIVTDLEFYELRYSGGEASFLRGFRAIYLGVFFNVVIMATVMLAGIKIGSVMLGLSGIQTVLLVSIVTVFYASIGGLRGVILTDFFQFILSMIGMIIASIFIVKMPEIGSLNALFTHENVAEKIDFLPDMDNKSLWIELLIIPLAVQWWSTWYPGSEPGGGGYVAQRMLSTKDESGAVKATLLFNIAHYALRPWPWILIALASLIVFPDLDSLAAAFPQINENIIGNDLAFPAMLSLLPAGLKGLLLASLIAALMSTISTHLNWGASYVVNDMYGRFIKPDATEKEKVMYGKISTIILMIFAGYLAIRLQTAKQSFDLLLQIGAGTGLIFILRWFWWRINAYSEIVAMIVSFVIAIVFSIFDAEGIEIATHVKLVSGVLITTLAWIITTYITPATNTETLKSFYLKIKPKGSGWEKVKISLNESELNELESNNDPSLSNQIIMMLLGTVLVYAALFGTGSLLYGNYGNMILFFVILIVSVLGLFKLNRQ